MPLIPSKYHPPKKIFRNSHVSTLYAALFRKVESVKQKRERLELSDGDFMDLEWSFAPNKTENCIIVFHGLEGNANRHYVLGTAKIFNENNFDCCAAHYRNCSGERNRVFHSYHSGRTDDIKAVIDEVLGKKKYRNIVLKGFSLGGNLILKYAGENPEIPTEIKALIAISAPIELKGAMEQLQTRRNFLYTQNFLFDLKKKLKIKSEIFPEQLTQEQIKAIKTLEDFDNIYTSKANGFADADDYYRKSSAKQFLKNIKIPTLIINAKNDSFLSESCYPVNEAENNPILFLEIPDFGGHVGFVDENNVFYNEKRAVEFVRNLQM
ncbi:alpha/beta fold hydrolase [Chryseobacterium suipulveris]|uniref:Alpha/beta fold hydrolase n=1 Tax=Chryseobacterium suipulveris TaxID=2929800 RepID=A0ABY4BLJ0_9FLAO|nr:alpha/beta fold hydrolase [Chryseobacterium suipulveris]UOE40040.1 alpha/beta fold hydrolase [Chryseobacterium suipulveris]